MGILECRPLLCSPEVDRFMNVMLRSRISRRVIAEQYLSLTEAFNSLWHFPDSKVGLESHSDSIGEVFLHCNAQQVVQNCFDQILKLARQVYGPRQTLPALRIQGHLTATFPYILTHLQYIIGELLRNSIQALVGNSGQSPPQAIEVLICEAPQHVILRFSDQGGGIAPELMPSIWSFAKGSRSQVYLDNLSRVPKLAATMQELKMPDADVPGAGGRDDREVSSDASLSSFTARPPNLRLGMGLPISRLYSEFYAGSLELHNLDGYGVDAFLQISKLGNQNEQLTTRTSIDSV